MVNFSITCRRGTCPHWAAGALLSLAGLVSAGLAAAQEPSTATEADRQSALVSRVIANQKQSEIDLDQFERVERVESRKTGADPHPADTKTWRLFPTSTGADKLPLSPDAQPLADGGYRSDLEKLEKYLVWVVQDGAAQKEAHAKADRKRKERFDLIDATQQAFFFTLEGKETRGDHTLLRYSMIPNPKYRPTSRNSTVFTRVRGTVWIDEQSSQLAKIEGTVTQDISLELFFAKVYKGSHFMQERYEVAPGIWEPTFEQYDFDGRKFLLPYSIHERTFYSSYKRVGPPKQAVEIVRAELSKLRAEAGSQ